MRKRLYKTIDLCAGIGGIRKGFEKTGKYKNVLAAETDEFAARTYEHLYGEDPRNDLTSDEFLNKLKETDYDVLLAGFPCQPFSHVGKMEGFEDKTRGTIFFSIAKIIRETRPKALLLENVEFLLWHNKRDTISTIIKILEEELEYKIMGIDKDDDGAYSYKAENLIRNTVDFGLPQNRPRVFLVAFDKRKYGTDLKMLPKNTPTGWNRHSIFKTVADIIDTDVEKKYYMSRRYFDTLVRHKERQKNKGYGFGYCILNEKDNEKTVSHAVLATGGSGKERNLIIQPHDGYTYKRINKRQIRLNDHGVRVMTPNEWGRLQGFVGYAFVDTEGKDTFSFPENMSDAQKYKQFGNAVSIPVAEAMGEFIFGCLEILLDHETGKIYKLIYENSNVTMQDITRITDLDIANIRSRLNKLEKVGFIKKVGTRRSMQYVIIR